MALLIARTVDDYNGAARNECRKSQGGVSELPSEPPHNNKKPEDKDEEDDVPEPAASLAFCHIVHASERASKNAGRFCECVVLSYFSRSVTGKKVANAPFG
jgi:hypothetical protein